MSTEPSATSGAEATPASAAGNQGAAAEATSAGGAAPQAEAPDAEIVDQTETAASATDATTQAPTTSDDWARIQDELRQLRTELADARGALTEAQERADRYHANWQRSAADFLNWKRRADQEKSDATRLGEAVVIADLLRVLDDFERAFVALPAELRRLTWIEGIHMIWGKLFAILEARGLAPIEALGRDFDPREHEAVLREDDADPSEQTAVVEELQRGYRFHDRVIRPTLVTVGRPKAAGGEPTATPTETEGRTGGTTDAQASAGAANGVGSAGDASASATTAG
ncbi:MAG: nucleotide exchange factor GrpE [Chloroflexota bacterium]|nr:nucleotide exchange factor GrpE [Chloroflexota bacterium]